MRFPPEIRLLTSPATELGQFPNTLLRSIIWLNVTEGVQHGQVGCRLDLEHLPEGLIPIVQNRLEDLQSGHHPAGAVNEIRVVVAKLAQ